MMRYLSTSNAELQCPSGVCVCQTSRSCYPQTIQLATKVEWREDDLRNTARREII